MAVAIVSSDGDGTTANATSSTIKVPPSLVSGNLIITVVTVDQNTGSAFTGWPTGYNEIYAIDNGTSIRQECRYKVSDGTETSFSLGHVNNMSSHRTVQISGQHASTAPAGATATGSGNPSPDPPALNPAGWDVEETGWLAIMGYDNGNLTVTDEDPTNYAVVGASSRGASSQSTGTCMAFRLLSAASEDPDVFAISANSPWIAATVGVPPAAGGGGGPTQPPRTMHQETLRRAA
jgi:hypothetical protein